MSFVAIIDFISFLAVIATVIILVRGWNQGLPRDIKLLIHGILLLSLFHHFSNILEWGGISNVLDPWEDFLELLIPMLWFILIYSYLKELTTDDLRKSAKRLKESQEIAQLGQWELDLISNNLYWSDEIYSLFEIDPVGFEASYEAFIDAVHPDDRELVEKSYSDSVKNKTSYNITHRLLLKNGVVKHVNEICHTEYDKKGKAIRSIGIVQDITKLQQAEFKLTESEEKYRNLVDNINEVIFSLDINGIFTFVSQSVKALTGHNASEIIGQPFVQFVHKDYLQTLSESYQLVIAGNDKSSEYKILDKNGESIWVESSSSPIYKNGKTIGLRGVIADITDRKQAEKEKKQLEMQLQQTQKMESIGTLAGGIAHDFNNILFPIVGHTEMLLQDVPENDPLRASLDQIYSGAMRARDLVQQILTFSRQEKSELMLIKMQPIVKEALKLIRSTIPTTIDIKQNISSQCGIIKADPIQIHQVVMNLATNAFHAMEETGGILKVDLKEANLDEHDADIISADIKPGAYVCLSVSDTGSGMDQALTKKIFDPFFTTKKTGKGTGMGLSVVHGIVTSLNGVIQVYSNPGKGTQFLIYLPVEKQLFKKQETYQMEKAIQGGIEQILLVDDEEDIITMEKLILERLGYKVTSRTSSIEALEAFRANPDRFKLVITDMAMPNMAGDRLSAELTKIRPDIPILLCTGFSETMSEEKAASLGIKGFLLKPIVMKDLAQKIREVLD